MHCEQIRKYLDEYAAGELPGYKMAWVAQHLAGCPSCRDASREAHQRALTRVGNGAAEVAATAPKEWAAASIPVQRPVPRWLRWAAAGAFLLLLAGGVWLFLRGPAPARTPPQRSAPGGGGLAVTLPVLAGLPAPRPESAVTPTTVEIRGDIALRIESVTQGEDGLQVAVRFQGRGLLPPGDPDRWVAVTAASGERAAVHIHPVTVDARGLSAELHFRPPAGGPAYTVELGAISQVVPYRYTLLLPDPAPGLKQIDRELGGLPEGIMLERYGIIGDVLHVYLRTSRFWPESIPDLYLQDEAGSRIAPAGEERTVEAGATTAHFQYALPKELPLPVQLVGDGYHRKEVGPWKITGATLAGMPADHPAGD